MPRIILRPRLTLALSCHEVFSGGLVFSRSLRSGHICVHTHTYIRTRCMLVVYQWHQKRLAAGYANGFHGNLFKDRDLSGIVWTNPYHLRFLKKKIAWKMQARSCHEESDTRANAFCKLFHRCRRRSALTIFFFKFFPSKLREEKR